MAAGSGVRARPIRARAAPARPRTEGPAPGRRRPLAQQPREAWRCAGPRRGSAAWPRGAAARLLLEIDVGEHLPAGAMKRALSCSSITQGGGKRRRERDDGMAEFQGTPAGSAGAARGGLNMRSSGAAAVERAGEMLLNGRATDGRRVTRTEFADDFRAVRLAAKLYEHLRAAASVKTDTGSGKELRGKSAIFNLLIFSPTSLSELSLTGNRRISRPSFVLFFALMSTASMAGGSSALNLSQSA